MKKQILTAAAIAALISLSSIGAQACGGGDGTCTCGGGGKTSCGAAAAAAAPPPKTEHCYGVAKAGKNDCHGPSHSCASLAKKDGDKEEFIEMPVGLCEKLVGGSLTKGGK